MFQTNVEVRTHIFRVINFAENHAVYEVMWKKWGRERGVRERERGAQMTVTIV
jgi:hypothetical protein